MTRIIAIWPNKVWCEYDELAEFVEFMGTSAYKLVGIDENDPKYPKVPKLTT